MSRTVKTFALSATLILAPTGLALAATAPAKSLEVPVKAYEINNPEGAKAVLTRIERAAERVCTATTVRLPVQYRIRAQACQTEAIANAVAQLDADFVTKAWQNKTAQ